MKSEGSTADRAEIRRTRSRQVIIVFADVITIILSYFFALFVRFDFIVSKIPPEHIDGCARILPAVIILTIAVYYFFHLYQSIWSYASVAELNNIVKAYLILAPCFILINRIRWQRIPWSSLFIAYVLSALFCMMIRFGYRYMRFLFKENNYRRRNNNALSRILIVGAGQAARELLKDLQMSANSDKIVEVLVDDNPNKHGRYLDGVPIEGSRYDIPDLVEKYRINEIIFAIPTATPTQRRDILAICKETGCHLMAMPGMMQILNGDVQVTRLREVDTIDLLGRDEIRVNDEEIASYLKGKTILVTGGGGSIGSELCRQIAGKEPKKLVIFDIYENNAYDIEQELGRVFPELDFETVIGSVRNTSRVEWVMGHYHPDIVFHAAAHKHVPLMETSPNEAIKNNVAGTLNTARAARKYGVGRFVLISTDKAVNPTNIMGASKRLCEMIIQAESRAVQKAGEPTVFSAVRFGNVLGSNGSVIPLFKKQIAEGGPVTVTDPNIIRYFMTIPEAVSLVLQAGCYARGGEIFVLDMGKPVRIDDMARNLIRLSGFQPDVDIPIVYTGLRPGEKLYEELLMDEEGLTKTNNDMIYIGKPIEMDDTVFAAQLDKLMAAAENETDPQAIKQLTAEIVPTYKPV